MSPTAPFIPIARKTILCPSKSLRCLTKRTTIARNSLAIIMHPGWALQGKYFLSTLLNWKRHNDDNDSEFEYDRLIIFVPNIKKLWDSCSWGIWRHKTRWLFFQSVIVFIVLKESFSSLISLTIRLQIYGDILISNSWRSLLSTIYSKSALLLCRDSGIFFVHYIMHSNQRNSFWQGLLWALGITFKDNDLL